MSTRGPLPFMKTLEDAKALCAAENDPFYFDAFMIEAWLGDVALDAAAEYAEKKNARERKLQSGRAWQSFLELFGHTGDDEFHDLYQSLLRFATYDDGQAEMLVRAFALLSWEHESGGALLAAKGADSPKRLAEAVALLRRSVQRWCDWLDALVHLDIHASWHHSPEQFDPDPEKRELAALGVNQRCFAGLNEFNRDWWVWHHGEAAERFKDSPKWQVVGRAMAARETRHWKYPEVDEVVIALWPLVTRHNWTYRDLLAVLRRVLPAPHRYPLEREQELATYCGNVLGLRKPKGRAGKSSRAGRPPGYEVALQICTPAAPTGAS